MIMPFDQDPASPLNKQNRHFEVFFYAHGMPDASRLYGSFVFTLDLSRCILSLLVVLAASLFPPLVLVALTLTFPFLPFTCRAQRMAKLGVLA
jgi:hypothetical protein